MHQLARAFHWICHGSLMKMHMKAQSYPSTRSVIPGRQVQSCPRPGDHGG